MIGWGILVGVLLLIWFFPLGISGSYNEEGPKAYWLIGPAKIQLYPAKKKKPASQDKNKKKQVSKTDKKKGGSYSDFIPLIKMIVTFLEEFRNKLRIKYLEMKLVMAGSDPCDLAIHYGEAWAAVGYLLPLLESVFVIKKHKVEVECDFTTEKTLLSARVDLVITFGRILSLGTVHGIRILKEYFRIIKLRKGGTTQ